MINTARATRNEVLKRAFAELATEEFKPYEHAEPHHFSDRFEKNMQKLIRAQRKSCWKYVNTVGKRVAAIVAAVLVLGSSVLTVEAARVPIVNFFVQTYRTCTDFIFNRAENEPPAPETIETVYMPTVLPDGFSETYRDIDSLNTAFLWEYKNGESLYFSQKCFGGLISLDTENCTEQKVRVNGAEGTLYQKPGLSLLLWTTTEYTFTLIYEGSGAADFDLVACAESAAAESFR